MLKLFFLLAFEPEPFATWYLCSSPSPWHLSSFQYLMYFVLLCDVEVAILTILHTRKWSKEGTRAHIYNWSILISIWATHLKYSPECNLKWFTQGRTGSLLEEWKWTWVWYLRSPSFLPKYNPIYGTVSLFIANQRNMSNRENWSMNSWNFFGHQPQYWEAQ